MKAPTVLLLSLLLAGCATAPPPKMESTFDPEQARLQLEPGDATILGSALIRQKGGGVVTCAGGQVVLIPATTYAIERMTRGFHPADSSGTSGFWAFYEGERPVPPPDPEYVKLSRSSTCDASGKFQFDKVSPGLFYLVTSIRWDTGYGLPQGGYLMKAVAVKPGETTTVVLAP
jgi:hypothetical protein